MELSQTDVCLCPFCENTTAKAFPFCKACGVKLSFCSHCGDPLPKDALFCSACGTKAGEE